MKKWLLSIAGIVTTISPVAAVIACGDGDSNDKDKAPGGGEGNDKDPGRDDKHDGPKGPDHDNHLTRGFVSSKSYTDFKASVKDLDVGALVTSEILGISMPILPPDKKAVLNVVSKYDDDTHLIFLNMILSTKENALPHQDIYKPKEKGDDHHDGPNPTIQIAVRSKYLTDSELKNSDGNAFNKPSDAALTNLKNLNGIKRAYIIKGQFQGGIAYLAPISSFGTNLHLYYTSDGIRKIKAGNITTGETEITSTSKIGNDLVTTAVVMVSDTEEIMHASEFTDKDAEQNGNYFGIPIKAFR